MDMTEKQRNDQINRTTPQIKNLHEMRYIRID